MLIYEYSERRVLMKNRVLIFDVERAGYSVLKLPIVLKELRVLSVVEGSAGYSVLNDARVLNETYVLSLDSGYRNVFDKDANVLL